MKFPPTRTASHAIRTALRRPRWSRVAPIAALATAIALALATLGETAVFPKDVGGPRAAPVGPTDQPLRDGGSDPGPPETRPALVEEETWD